MRVCKRLVNDYVNMVVASKWDFSYSILSLSMVTGLDIVVSTTLNMGGTD